MLTTNMYFSKLIKSNESANALQASQRAVVAGGTQGIGAGIALRFALAGASVWIIGRSEERGQEVMKKLQQASQEATRRRHSSISSSNDDQNQDSQAQHAFIRADLSDVDEVKRVVEVVKERAGSRGIEWLFETQGAYRYGRLAHVFPADFLSVCLTVLAHLCAGSTPTGNISNTAKGLDSHFAVQCLSRFGLASSLLQSGTVKQSVCLIAAPGGGSSTPLSYKDLELKQAKASSWGMMKMVAHGQRDASVIDAFTQVSSFLPFPCILTSFMTQRPPPHPPLLLLLTRSTLQSSTQAYPFLISPLA